MVEHINTNNTVVNDVYDNTSVSNKLDRASDEQNHKSLWWSLLDVIFVLLAPIFIVLGFFILLGPYVDDNPNLVKYGAYLSVQVLQVICVLLVSRSGLGPVRDFRFKFKWFDPLIGLVVFFITLIMARVVQLIAEQLFDFDSKASNTDIVKDVQGTPLIWVAFVIVVIMAPLSEELLYRGALLRIFQAFGNRLFGAAIGTISAILFSSLLFALLHFPDEPDLTDIIVLQVTIFILGIIFAITTIVTDRLGPSIFAHAIFNGITFFSLVFNIVSFA